MNPSLWLESIEQKAYPPLTERIKTDVLVIGGGLTGISCAHELIKTGKRVVLVEANRLLHGTTGYTTAKLTVQHGLIYHALEKRLGLEMAKCYYESNRLALEHVLTNIKTYHIEADLIAAPASVYTNDTSYIRDIENEFLSAERIGIPAKLSSHLPLPYEVNLTITFPDQYAFNVAKYLNGLLHEIEKHQGQIYEKSRVVRVKQLPHYVEATLQNGVMIQAEDVIIASHYPCHRALEFYFTKLMPHFSYCLALDAKILPDHLIISAETPVRSLRPAIYRNQNILLVAGESHSARETRDRNRHFEALREYADEYFNPTNEYFRFSTMDYLSSDQVPLIGRIHKKTPHIYLATGYGKWGMTKGVLASLLLKDLIIKGSSDYESLYAPTRFSRMLTKTFFAYNISQPYAFLKSKVLKKKTLAIPDSGQQRTVKVKGKTIGLYRDETGTLHLCDMACPHMRCTLRFNTAEKTYDCMCHGSRFHFDGTYLDGPAKRDLIRYDWEELMDNNPAETKKNDHS